MKLDEAENLIREEAGEALKREFAQMFMAWSAEQTRPQAGPNFSRGLALLLECEARALAIVGEQLRARP